MNNSIVLSSSVLNTIKSLPREQQFQMVSAIAAEMIFGVSLRDELNEEEKRIYSIIKSHVSRDSLSYNNNIAV